MSTSSGHGEERVRKVLDHFVVCQDRWQAVVSEGKVILDSILLKIKVTEEATAWDPSCNASTVEIPVCHKKFDLELQESCLSLQDSFLKLEAVCQDFQAIEDKLDAIDQLANLSASQITPVSDVSFSLRGVSGLIDQIKIVNNCYIEQLRLNKSVCESVAVCKSFEEAVFCVAIWIHQPSMEQKFFLSRKMIEEFHAELLKQNK